MIVRVIFRRACIVSNPIRSSVTRRAGDEVWTLAPGGCGPRRRRFRSALGGLDTARHSCQRDGSRAASPSKRSAVPVPSRSPMILTRSCESRVIAASADVTLLQKRVIAGVSGCYAVDRGRLKYLGVRCPWLGESRSAPFAPPMGPSWGVARCGGALPREEASVSPLP